MQPHAETVQGADSWLHQESHYFSARAAPRARAPRNLWASAMQGMGICIWSWVGQQDHSSPDAISFRYHSTVKREDSTRTPLWRIHSTHEDKGTPTPSPSSPMRKEVSHSCEMSPKYGGIVCRKCAWSPEGQRNSPRKEESQTNLNRILLLCCLLHSICRSKEEQMAQGRERKAQMQPCSPPVPATACSLTRDKWEGQIVQNALTNCLIQNPWLLLAVLWNDAYAGVKAINNCFLQILLPVFFLLPCFACQTPNLCQTRQGWHSL